MNSFDFYFPGKRFIAPSLLRDVFSGFGILGGRVFSSTFRISLPPLLPAFCGRMEFGSSPLSCHKVSFPFCFFQSFLLLQLGSAVPKVRIFWSFLCRACFKPPLVLPRYVFLSWKLSPGSWVFGSIFLFSSLFAFQLGEFL